MQRPQQRRLLPQESQAALQQVKKQRLLSACSSSHTPLLWHKDPHSFAGRWKPELLGEQPASSGSFKACALSSQNWEQPGHSGWHAALFLRKRRPPRGQVLKLVPWKCKALPAWPCSASSQRPAPLGAGCLPEQSIPSAPSHTQTFLPLSWHDTSDNQNPEVRLRPFVHPCWP